MESVHISGMNESRLWAQSSVQQHIKSGRDRMLQKETKMYNGPVQKLK